MGSVDPIENLGSGDPMAGFLSTPDYIDTNSSDSTAGCQYETLTGRFGIFVQFLLAVLAFSCLIGK